MIFPPVTKTILTRRELLLSGNEIAARREKTPHRTLSQLPGRLPDVIAQYEAVLRIRPDPEQMVNRLGAGRNQARSAWAAPKTHAWPASTSAENKGF